MGNEDINAPLETPVFTAAPAPFLPDREAVFRVKLAAAVPALSGTEYPF